MFSARTNFDTAESPLAAAVKERHVTGDLINLTGTNPTACGLDLAVDLAALSSPDASLYQPDSMGMFSAREAIARYYTDHDCAVSPQSILLTASTSESYSFLFRLLCDPGDNILVPQPGYPLFDYLAEFDSISVKNYSLHAADSWSVDLEGLRSKIDARTRAIVVVHPNNPTGHFFSEADRHALQTISEEHGLALIADEVFLDYEVEGRGSSFAKFSAGTLTFVLSGLSKVCALPQMKLGWIVASGRQSAEALARLEMIADTFLSVGTPPQVALPRWLAQRKTIQTTVTDRVRANLQSLDQIIAGTMISRFPVEAGWASVLRIPATAEDTDLAIHLIREAGVFAHPGSFYRMPEQGYLVISLLAPEARFHEGIMRLVNGIRFANPT